MNAPVKLAAPKQVKVVNLDRQMSILRFSPDGKLLVAGGQDATVRRLDATKPDLAALPPLTGHRGWVTTLAFHADGKRLFTADSWGELRCWPFADAQPKPAWVVPQAHDGWVRSLAVSPDGQTVATCGADGKICLWSTADGKKQKELIGGPVEVYSLAYHPSGALVSGDYMAVVKQWDIAAGKAIREFDAKSMYGVFRLQEVGGARIVMFDSKFANLAVAGAMANEKGPGGPVVLLFDWSSGKLAHTIKLGAPLDGYVYDLTFHPDGTVLGVTNGQPGQGKLFLARPGEAQPFFTAPLPNPHSLAVAPGFNRLIVSATNGGSNGNGRLLDKNKEYPGNFSPLHDWDFPG